MEPVYQKLPEQISRYPIYQVDAFSDKVFGGNPAAVVLLERWLPDDVMQRIALENNVAETAFFIPLEQGYHIRWFTPEIEQDLCGHATLAAAHVISMHLDPTITQIRFQSNSGELTVRVTDELLTLDFPARIPVPSQAPAVILDAFGIEPSEVLKARDYLLVFEREAVIQEMQPKREILDQIRLDPGGVCVTAPGERVDFVSRFFTPQASIFEDPVTGSAHCSLIPYWSKRLGREKLVALQLSARGGKLYCQNAGERVLISGRAVTYLEGEIRV
ncbi:MAG: PhzF family phenazine biosynthesis protein [Anaerolineales bacterium]|nr:PhzF family phenazine biosynthesis protein [Anaerolineales bacterium]